MLGMILSRVDASMDYTCGMSGVTFSGQFPNIVALVVTIIQIAVPVLLIIFGMLDLGKAVMAQKEDEIKKGQQTFVKRIIAAAIVFFVIFIVKLVVGIIATDQSTVANCINCFTTADVHENSCRTN